MGLCESGNNQAAANNQGGILSNITGALGSNNNQTTQNTGVLGTVKNLVGNNNTTANSTSKMDTVVKVGQFVAQNKDALGNLVK